MAKKDEKSENSKYQTYNNDIILSDNYNEENIKNKNYILEDKILTNLKNFQTKTNLINNKGQPSQYTVPKEESQKKLIILLLIIIKKILLSIINNLKTFQ